MICVNLPFAPQQMEILGKELPDMWKLAIAKNIENNLFSKVVFHHTGRAALLPE